MAPKVKLTYFPLFGKGETIKLCLAAGKVIGYWSYWIWEAAKEKKNLFLVSRALRKNNCF